MIRKPRKLNTDFKGVILIEIKERVECMKVVKRVEQITVEYDQSDHVYGDINNYRKLGFKKISSGLNHGVYFVVYEKQVQMN
jgi:hypothetical protein